MKKKKKEIIRIYFDTETFNFYDEEEQPKKKSKRVKLPLIIPYLIGACTDEPGSYVYWVGTDSTQKFISWLQTICHGKKAVLYAFNVDYDFQAIKPFIIEYFPHIKISYHLTAKKKFVFGSLSSKKLSIQIKDLFNWDRSYSVKKYYEYIQKLAETEPRYKEALSKYQIKDLKKGELEDYYKKNLHQKDGKYYYWDENENLRTLDLEAELDYLKNDVIGLPLILFHITTIRKDCIKLLKLDDFSRDKKLSNAISVPSFGKRLLGYQLIQEDPGLDAAEMVDITYRCPTTCEDYYSQDISYFGGFVANNKHITKLLNSFDKEGKPNIISVDVNSMYPWVMSEGVPAGVPTLTKPKGKQGKDYVVWHTVYFEKKINDKELYKYKPQYDCFNNKFFGDGYFHYIEEAGECTRRVYILDEVYQLFKRACDSHIKIQQTLYQEMNHDLKKFVDFLYAVKEKPKSKQEKANVKLIMNSLYGKLAERYHEDYFTWNTDDGNFRNVCDLRLDRDSILAGLFITSKSRVRLISTILDEIDNGNTFLGCDTDSIKLVMNNPLTFETDPSKLGYWGIEGYYTDFVHNQKKKKYYLYDQTGKSETKMAASGIPKKILYKLSHEDKITLFSEENDVLFPKIKNTSQRNIYWQICIKKVDVRFNYKKGRSITHIYKDGRIVPYV